MIAKKFSGVAGQSAEAVAGLYEACLRAWERPHPSPLPREREPEGRATARLLPLRGRAGVREPDTKEIQRSKKFSKAAHPHPPHGEEPERPGEGTGGD